MGKLFWMIYCAEFHNASLDKLNTLMNYHVVNSQFYLLGLPNRQYSLSNSSHQMYVFNELYVKTTVVISIV